MLLSRTSETAEGGDSLQYLGHEVGNRRRLALTASKLLFRLTNILNDLLTALFCCAMSQDLDERFLFIERQLIGIFEDTSKRGGL